MSTITAPVVGFAPRRVAPGRPAPRPAAVRLTRRGRLLLSVLTLLVAVSAAVLATGGGLASAVTPGSGGGAAAVERVTVRPGETLWAIAERTAPGVDPRETVAELMDLNALETSSVPAGSVLLLPR